MPPVSGPDPKPGDLIKFSRRGYQHWGIYVGNGDVVHIADLKGCSSFAAVRGWVVVRKGRVEDIAKKCDYKVHNKYDHKVIPRHPDEVVRDALAQVGTEMSYNLTRKNCEHFATELRYGKGFCGQVTKFRTHGTVAGITALAAVAVTAFAAYLIGRKKLKKLKKLKA
ncbi:phospholipase A and acyltransferase 4-like isoform X2 [Ascaphus truei]|uniref:phospholipase A and acyltransferase 4-like isoform X2 n=1 Tax=Ascaphus truei TaxID=8439 RepID=UPI003F59C3CE